MALPVTERAKRETRKTQIEPQLVLEIEGVATIFGAVEILEFIRIGDPDLYIGNDWRIGGLRAVLDQADIISLESGGTKIDQQLQPDKGSVSSVTSVQVALIDRDLIATRLISPGVVVDDILGRKATLWMGFKNTAFKNDYVQIISGIIDDTESAPESVKLNIAHPEQMKRQRIFEPVDVLIDGSIDNAQTTIPLEPGTVVPLPVLGPDGVTYDSAIRFYIRVEDEIIRYTGRTGNDLTGCVRGEHATEAVQHAPDGDGNLPAKTAVQLSDSVVPLALKVMLSGKNDFYREGLAVSKYLHPDPSTTVANSIFFDGVELNRDYGVTAGDFVTITGATNGANNCVAKPILEIVVTDAGSYAVIDDVTFVEESSTAAVVAFRSQYDSLGYGLAMSPDQVDVDEHTYWHNFQLAPYQMRFLLQDGTDGKELIDKEIYKPVGAYSIPRRGRCSMGFHVGPITTETLPVLSRDNIKEPDKIRMRRTIGRNFYNTIVTKFEKVALTGRAASGVVSVSQESKNRIPVGNRTMLIDSNGLRRNLDGEGIATRTSLRYLGRYKFAAEFFESIGLLLRDGYNIEPGDAVLFDPTDLHVSNTEAGNRKKPAKVFQVTNKSLDLKTGDVRVSLTDTNFEESERYGVISPSSLVVSGTTTTIIIQDSFGAFFPGHESRKWRDYVGLPIRVHSADFSFDEEVTLLEIDGGDEYQLNLDPTTPLSGAPLAGYIVDVGDFPNTADPNDSALYKAGFDFMGKTVEIVTAADDTHFEVAGGDIGYFEVGGFVRVHSVDYANDSGENGLEIVGVVGNVVEVASTFGFTPGAGDIADGMNLPDGSKTYRVF